MDFDFTTETITPSLSTLIVSSAGALELPVGTTVQRPSPVSGMIRYNSALDTVEFYDNVKWNPIGAQISQLVFGSFTANSGTSTYAFNSTAPTTSGGSQVWSQVITPASITSVVRIELASILGVSTGNASVTVALFRGTTCIDVKTARTVATGLLGATTTGTEPFAMILIDSPATTSAITYSLRVGSSTGTWYFGQGDGGDTFGGPASGKYVMSEILT